jgi:hypothetical protein
MFPSLGNHDSRASTQHGFAYLESFVLPENGAGSRYPDHAELEADLAATAQPWKIAYFHRPPYSAGGHHGSDLAVRAAFAPIFE